MKKLFTNAMVGALAVLLFFAGCNDPLRPPLVEPTNEEAGGNNAGGETGGGEGAGGEEADGGNSEEGGEGGGPGENENPPPDALIIQEAEGWLETDYVTWQPFSGAEKYNVYYKGGGVSAWTRIDDPLIRSYGTYWRADIPGLAAGVYNVKVAAVAGGSETGEGEASRWRRMTVQASPLRTGLFRGHIRQTEPSSRIRGSCTSRIPIKTR